MFNPFVSHMSRGILISSGGGSSQGSVVVGIVVVVVVEELELSVEVPEFGSLVVRPVDELPELVVGSVGVNVKFSVFPIVVVVVVASVMVSSGS